MVKVESMEKWNEVAPKLWEWNFHPWQFQFDVNQAEGFHALFSAFGSGLQDVEIVTHSQDVREAIFKYNREYNAKHKTDL